MPLHPNIAAFFQQEYYPDIPLDTVASHLEKPEVQQAAIDHLHQNFYSDMPKQEFNDTIKNKSAASDSLDLYNMALSHVTMTHPDLGTNPPIIKFDSANLIKYIPQWNISDSTEYNKTRFVSGLENNMQEIPVTKEGWVKLDLMDRIQDLQKRKNIIQKIENDSTLLNNPLYKSILQTHGGLEGYKKDIVHKEEHNSILQKAVDTGIYPIGLYNDHDVGFHKPIK